MLQYGICTNSYIPMRAQMSEQSEMTTQLLFGDLVKIIDQKGNWFEIEQIFDRYRGWIDKKEITELTQEAFDKLTKQKPYILGEPFSFIKDAHGNLIMLGIGSAIYNLKANQFSLNGKSYLLTNEQYIQNYTKNQILSLAQNLLNTAYLWGGKSVFGIDCSGLVQTVFRVAGYDLPRDASQQATKGNTINFITDTQACDLAFFDNEEGNITHVGILIDQHSIIHASGKVRIDTIDHHGIFDTKTRSYSHKLRLIKRII